jgi:hypothetical protein
MFIALCFYKVSKKMCEEEGGSFSNRRKVKNKFPANQEGKAGN